MMKCYLHLWAVISAPVGKSAQEEYWEWRKEKEKKPAEDVSRNMNLWPLKIYSLPSTHTEQLPVGASLTSLWPHLASPAWPSASSPGSCRFGAGKAAASHLGSAGLLTSAWVTPGCLPAPWSGSASSCAEGLLPQAPGLWSALHPWCCTAVNCDNNKTGSNEQSGTGSFDYCFR